MRWDKMMMKLMTVVLLLAGAVGLLRASPSSVASETIVTVEKRPITRAMVDRQVDMMAMFLMNRKPDLPAEKLASFKKKQLKPLSDLLFRQTVVDEALAPTNVHENAIAVKTIRENAVKKLGKRGQTFDDLRALARDKGYLAEFDRSMASDIRFHSYLISSYSNRYFVTSADLAKSRERIAKYNERAIASNRVIVARAKRILAEVDGGASFAALADRYSEDDQREPGGALGDCDANDFVENEHVWAALQLLQPKECTELMTLDNGYAIYRVNHKKNAAESATTAPSLDLSRIYFRRPFVYPEKSDEELYDEVLGTRHEKLLSDVYLALRKTVNVVYNTSNQGKENSK